MGNRQKMFPRDVENIPLLLGNLFPLLLLVFVSYLPITNAVRIEEKGKIIVPIYQNLCQDNVWNTISKFYFIFLRINLSNNEFNIYLRESNIYIWYVKKQQYYFV